MLIALLLAGCISAPFQCESSDPEICALEVKVYNLEQEAAWDRYKAKQAIRSAEFKAESQAQAKKTCEFAHGAGSILCP